MKKPIILLILMLVCWFSLSLTLSAKSPQNIVYAPAEFPITLSTGESLNFQHPPIALVLASNFHANFTVQSGTFNTSTARLTMFESSGVLRFTSLNSCSLSLVNALISVNDIPDVTSMTAGDFVVISWSGGESWFPASSIMGMIGLAMFGLTPVWAVYKVKKKKDYYAIMTALILFAIAYGLVYGWLTT